MIIETNELIKVEDSDIVKSTVIVPEGVISIKTGAFEEVGPQVKKIELPQSLEYISADGISNTNIVEIKIPEGVKELGTHAITRNPLLQFIHILGIQNKPKFNSSQICGNPHIKQVRIGLVTYFVNNFRQGLRIFSNSREKKGYHFMDAEVFKPAPDYRGNIKECWCIKDGIIGNGLTEAEAIVSLENNIFLHQNEKKLMNLTIDDSITLLEYEFLTDVKLSEEWLKEKGYTRSTSLVVKDIISQKELPDLDKFVTVLASLYEARQNNQNNKKNKG